MKKTFAIIFASFLLTYVTAQVKKDVPDQRKDTIISITMSLDQFKAILTTIDQNIDSKQLTKQLLSFLQQNAQIVQPADKPKGELKPKN